MKRFIGDKGKSILLKGRKLSKDNLIFEVLGELDELNSSLGIARAFLKNKRIENWIISIQKDIFNISSWLSGAKKPNLKEMIKKIDKKLEYCQKNIPIQKRFIIPGASKQSSLINLSRVVCRRAERVIVKLTKNSSKFKDIIIYLNHLSKFLFFLSRYVNKRLKRKEEFF